LHDFAWCEGSGVVIDAGKGVVHNGAVAAGNLGYDADGRHPQSLHVADVAVGEDEPLTFIDHVGKFLSEEVGPVDGGLVGAPDDGGIDAVFGPGGGMEDDGSTGDR